MRNYRVSAATSVVLDYGVELDLGLGLFAETTALRADLKAAQDPLDVAHEERRARRKPLVAARVRMRHATWLLRQTIRSASKAAEIADDGRRGPICKAVFPDGLAEEVKAQGKSLIERATKLRDRLQNSKLPSVADYRKQWLPEIQGDLGGLTAAVDTHAAATADYVGAFSVELAARLEHRRTVDRLAGEVRAAFPGDRAKQDLVFPEPDEVPAEKAAKAKPAPAAPATPNSEAPK